MSQKGEIWTPAEKAKRNARSGYYTGRIAGWCLLGLPTLLIGSTVAVKQALSGELEAPEALLDPDTWPDGSPKTGLFRRTALAAREQQERRQRGEDDEA